MKEPRYSEGIVRFIASVVKKPTITISPNIIQPNAHITEDGIAAIEYNHHDTDSQPHSG